MWTPDSAGSGGGTANDAAVKSFEKFLQETSGGFHATADDWTTVGRDKEGFPVVKGSPEDVSPNAPFSAGSRPEPKKLAVVIDPGKQPLTPDPAKPDQTKAVDSSGAPVATTATATGAVPGTTMRQVTPRQQTPQQAATEAETSGDGSRTMYFPHRVVLTVKHGHTIDFPPGANPVPNSLIGHYYLKANKVSETPLGSTAAPGAGTQAGGNELNLDQARALVQKLEAQEKAKAASAKTT
jgi:hypothetical protein